ncbi:MaoC family dehydratase N-terminal domain-containing protein [Paenibacillus sp. KQZ6P-2]|uniref:MaoC family dehydratase N-terminal domain-containing protein n=1 Tax=Paenibacillus mangrovi TaxID=2931978 RepID=A0A9X2B3N0_9BACL|nr:MaoC family dehydratase N-terminal domain-containing protein [Paenibacillus mangrovi]MCJ8013591.1 MaoC family dehydratase N-terminal domain-containing protein [Paenibacillus mangrovi]
MKKLQHQLYISAEAITQYAKSIEAPVQMLNGVQIAPTTMPIIFWNEFDIPWLNKNVPLIHGSQHFSYEKPIMAGMTLDCELSLTKVEKKAGRKGELTLFTHNLVCTCNGDLIVTAETVLISLGDGT